MAITITQAQDELSGEHCPTPENDGADGQDNAVVPCLHCRHKKRRCDGHRPTCWRCRRFHIECVYGDKAVAELSNNLISFKRTMDMLDVEMERVKRGMSVVGTAHLEPPCGSNNDANVIEEARTNSRTESEVIRGVCAKVKNASWVITLTNNGARLEFTSFCQFYEMLGRLSGSASTVHRALTSTFPYPIRRPQNPFTFKDGVYISVHTVKPGCDTKYVPISSKLEEIFLNFIIWYPVHCGSSNVVTARFAIGRHTQKPSVSFKTLCYVLGALNAHHYFVHHATTAGVLRLLPAGIDTSKFGRELAARFFAKARKLLGDQIFDADTDELCMNTVDALFCMFLYSFQTNQPQLAATYSRMMHRVATHLNYHRALRDPTKTSIDAEEIMKAIMWDWIDTCELTVATEIKSPTHGTINEIPLMHLLKLTASAAASIPEERFQTIIEILYRAKLTQIDPKGPLPTWLTHETLNQSVEILERWAYELPSSLHLSSLEGPWHSCFSFLRAVNLQLIYHMSLLDLYESYLRVQSTRLELGLGRRIERRYSDAAIMLTRLIQTYLRYGECTFFSDKWERACEAHAWLARSTDKEIAHKHQLYVGKAWKVEQYVKRKGYLCLDIHWEDYDPDFIARKGEGYKKAAELKEECLGTYGTDDTDFVDDYFVLKKMQGVGW